MRGLLVMCLLSVSFVMDHAWSWPLVEIIRLACGDSTVEL